MVSRGARSTNGCRTRTTSSEFWRPIAFTVVLATACNTVLNLDQFGGAVLDAPDSSTGDAQTADTGLDVQRADSTATDARGIDTGDGGLTDASLGEASPVDIEDAQLDATPTDETNETADGETADGPEGSAAADGGGANDGVATDTTSTIDAGVDWCLANGNSSTTFCRDFDDGRSYMYAFSSTYINLVPSGKAPSIVSNVAASPPNSLLFDLPLLPECGPDGGVSDGGAPCSEQVQLNTNVLAHSLVNVSFAIFLENYDVANVHDVSLVRVAYNGGAWSATYDLEYKSAYVLETTLPLEGGAPHTSRHPALLPPLGKWVTIGFTVDVANTGLGTSFNGALQSVARSVSPPIQGSVEVTVGVNTFVGPTTPLRFYLDNVIITTN